MELSSLLDGPIHGDLCSDRCLVFRAQMCFKPSTLLLMIASLFGVASAVLCGLGLTLRDPRLVGIALGFNCISTFLVIFVVVVRYEKLKAVDRGPGDGC